MKIPELRLRLPLTFGRPETEIVNMMDPALIATIDIRIPLMALARTQRFGGLLAEDQDYNNLQHSLVVAATCEFLYLRDIHKEHRTTEDQDKVALAGLLHDMPEAFGLGDIVSPLKRTIGSGTYELMHSHVEHELAKRFGLYAPAHHRFVVAADRLALEAEQLLIQRAPHAEFEKFQRNDKLTRKDASPELLELAQVLQFLVDVRTYTSVFSCPGEFAHHVAEKFFPQEFNLTAAGDTVH